MYQPLKELFRATFGEDCEHVGFIRAHASPRKIFRLTSKSRSVVGVLHKDEKENRAFVGFAKHFAAVGLAVPKVFAFDQASNCYLIEDLGDKTLYDLIVESRSQNGGLSKEVMEYYREAIKQLVRFQVDGAEEAPWELCVGSSKYDERAMLWDLNFFKYHILNATAVAFDQAELQNDFEKIIKKLGAEKQDYFLYRDFQSRNIMLREGRLFFIDFQGGRKGPLHYDLASLLFQGKAELSQAEREQMLSWYLNELSARNLATPDFKEKFYLFGLLFLLKVLGTYGLHGIVHGKRYFVESIPLAIKNSRLLLNSGDLKLELPAVSVALSNLESWYNSVVPVASDLLRVTIRSFSYSSGAPKDYSGNGGGFVFDLRSLPNPGREERYKSLTGRDKEVSDWLNSKAAVEEYYRSAFSLIDGAIQNFLTRGLLNINIAFGCTGGQHRSVYFAERIAADLKAKFSASKKVEVDLKHLEFPTIL